MAFGTLFEIGPVTKSFTAPVLADMADWGQAVLDGPVQDLLPVALRVPVRNWPSGPVRTAGPPA